MPRLNLIAARKKAHLSQAELATKVGAARKTVVAWESGTQTPQPLMCRQLETALNRKGDEHLFDIVPESLDETQAPLTCETTHTDGRFIASDSHDDILESEEDIDVDPRRRKVIVTGATTAIAVTTGITLMTNVPVTPPMMAIAIEPARYLSQARFAIETAWNDSHAGDYARVQWAINDYINTLAQLAYIDTPFKQQAASLMVEIKNLQIILANHNLQFATRVDLCIEAEQFAEISGDRDLIARAQYWHGDTYVYCYHRPQIAIPLLESALSNVDEDVRRKGLICSDLAIAHSQDKDQRNAKVNERKTLDYMGMARGAIPTDAAVDDLEGKAYLYLAETHSNRSYALLSHDLFEKSIGGETSKGYLVQVIIRKADAHRVLGDRDESLTCLTTAYENVLSVHRLTQISDVLSRMPSDWQQHKPIAELQGEVSQSLLLART